MLDRINGGFQGLPGQNTVTETKKVLTMVKNERMGGMVPKWETVTITRSLENAPPANPGMSADSKEPESFESMLAYQQTPAAQIPEIETAQPEEFGFGDLIDMINPLQHIPVVGHFYRSFTGDQIRPIGRIIGGAVFGGALGAAVNLVNTVIEEETGKDVAGNAYALAFNGEAPNYRARDYLGRNNLAPVTAEALLAYDPITEVILRPLPEEY